MDIYAHLMSRYFRCMHVAIGLMINQLSSGGAIFHFHSFGHVLIKHNNVMMYLTDTVSLSCMYFTSLDFLLVE